MNWIRVATQANRGSFATGVVQGAWGGVKALASDVFALGKAGHKVVTDKAYREQAIAKAVKAARAVSNFGGRAARDPIGTGEQVWNKAKISAAHAKQAFMTARDAAGREGRLANFYGQVVGRGGFEVGSILVPVAKLGLAGKGAKGASSAAKAASITSKPPQAERLIKSAVKLKTGAKTRVGHRQDCVAAAAALKPPRKISRQELADWYQKQGDYFGNPKNLDNHMQGTDFGKPVMRRTLPENTELIQYVRADGKPGMYFARPGTSLETLGISEPPPRIMRRFVVKKPIVIIESTASEISANLASGVGGKGGGQQLILPKGWERSIEAVGEGT